MQNLEAAAKEWRAGACIFISSPEGYFEVRPAAFVYQTADGFAWVEPSYADPAGSATGALHKRTGKVVMTPNVCLVECEGGESITVIEYEPGENEFVGEPLDWFARHIKEAGLDWDAERERVRALID